MTLCYKHQKNKEFCTVPCEECETCIEKDVLIRQPKLLKKIDKITHAQEEKRCIYCKRLENLDSKIYHINCRYAYLATIEEMTTKLKDRLCYSPETCEIQDNFICNHCKHINNVTDQLKRGEE